MSIDVRREAGAAASGDRLSPTWEVDLDYVSIARYASLIVERACRTAQRATGRPNG